VSLLQPGDAINATGTPEARDEVVLLVTDPAGVVLLGDLGGETGDDPAGASGSPLAILGVIEGADGLMGARGGAVSAALAAGRGADPASLALATLLLTAAVGAGLAVYRVTLTRRRVRVRIKARLDAIAPGPPSPT
jgi:hypothetical protein